MLSGLRSWCITFFWWIWAIPAAMPNVIIALFVSKLSGTNPSFILSVSWKRLPFFIIGEIIE